MNELTPLPQLVAEIKILSQQTAANIIEIGKRLNVAKEQVEHGDWAGWLDANFDFSRQHANRFMRAATEFSNVTSQLQMSQTKIFALLDVPAADRETFISQPHEVNGQQKTVDEMTSRELAATIKALKDIEKAKADSDRLVQDQAADITKLKKDLDDAKVAQKMLADLKKPDTVTEEKRIEVIPPDYETTKQKLKDAMAKIDKLTDEQLGQAQAIFQQGKRAEIRSRLSMLAKDVGKHVKELELLVRILPGDESVSNDLTEIANILRDTADAVEQMESGVTIDAGFDSNVRPG